LDALIFDFDGVVVDSEPIHLECFRKVLESVGLRLSGEEYYAKYLGYDDHDCFAAVAVDKGAVISESQIARMTAAKTVLVRRAFAREILPLPGAVELIRSAEEAGVPLAVCSGALREEIELASRTIGVLGQFRLIVSAEDVSRGKPDPQGYRLCLERLSASCRKPLAPSRCLVVEDSPAGIEAARGAGMKVLAVTNSYPRDQLGQADRIVTSLAEVMIDQLESLCR
jgi:beta-phosphoglucomutase